MRPKKSRSEMLSLDFSAVGSQRQFVTYIEKGSKDPYCLRKVLPEVWRTRYLIGIRPRVERFQGQLQVRPML